MFRLGRTMEACGHAEMLPGQWGGRQANAWARNRLHLPAKERVDAHNVTPAGKEFLGVDAPGVPKRSRDVPHAGQSDV